MQEITNITAYRRGLKEKILNKAMTLFAENGIKAVKMDDIARSLGISKRTLYEIYDNKEVLLFEGIKTYMQLREQQMADFSNTNKNVMDIILHVYSLKVGEFSRTNPKFYDDIVRYPQVLDFLKKNKEKNRKQLSDFLVRGTEEGYFREDVDHEMVALLFDAVGQLVVEKRLFLRFSVEEVFNNFMFISLRGICTRKGIDVLDKFLESQKE